MTTSLWIIAGLALWVILVCIVAGIAGMNNSKVDQTTQDADSIRASLDPDRRMEDDYRAIERTVAKVRAGGAK